MKKLLSIIVGLSFLVATVGVSMAQDTKKEESTMKKKSKKGGKKKEETSEKKGGA
jgi:Ni/Co efflux regulator RcnB